MTTPIMVCPICNGEYSGHAANNHVVVIVPKEETGHNLWEMSDPNDKEIERIERQRD